MYLNLRSVKLLFSLSALIFLAGSCKNSKEPAAGVSADSKIAHLRLPAGFHADHLYSPGIHDQGSWVAMTFDDKGRMIASDQYGYLYRITLPPIGSDTATTKVKVEKLAIDIPGDTSSATIKIGYAHALMYAFNSLYVMINDEGDHGNKTRKS